LECGNAIAALDRSRSELSLSFSALKEGRLSRQSNTAIALPHSKGAIVRNLQTAHR